jgi:hypothetical protein
MNEGFIHVSVLARAINKARLPFVNFALLFPGIFYGTRKEMNLRGLKPLL